MFSRIYQLDFLPQGLFSQLLVRALTLAAPVHYWRSGVVLSLSKSRSSAALTTDNVTSIKLSATGPGAARMLLHLDNALQSLMAHIFNVRADVFAMCTCASCRAGLPDRATRWKMTDLAGAYLATNQLIFKCGGVNEVNLKRYVDIQFIFYLLIHKNTNITHKHTLASDAKWGLENFHNILSVCTPLSL